MLEAFADSLRVEELQAEPPQFLRCSVVDLLGMMKYLGFFVVGDIKRGII